MNTVKGIIQEATLAIHRHGLEAFKSQRGHLQGKLLAQTERRETDKQGGVWEEGIVKGRTKLESK